MAGQTGKNVAVSETEDLRMMSLLKAAIALPVMTSTVGVVGFVCYVVGYAQGGNAQDGTAVAQFECCVDLQDAEAEVLELETYLGQIEAQCDPDTYP